MLPVGIFIVIVMPFIIVQRTPEIDALLNLKLLNGTLYSIAGILMISTGLPLALWTVYVQMVRGFGTPVPVFPPKKLFVNGPYQYCRNPMALGIFIYYIGICLCFGNYTSFMIVAAFITLITLMIKFIEEPELERRFGKTYKEYKARVPFIIPRVFC